MTNKNHNNIKFRRIIEYKQFFADEMPIDVDNVLKQYDRSVLIRMAIVLSCHYGNISFPDGRRSLFSNESQTYIDGLNERFERFYHKLGIPKGTRVEVSTFRTALELWRHIFSIKTEEYQGTIKVEDEEYNLFKVLLALNEQIVEFTHSGKDYRLDELLFLNQFVTNDTNNFDYKQAIQPQLYYVFHLAQLCERNDVMRKASEVLFARWGITSWKQYVATLMCLANQTEEYRKSQQGGVPIIPLHNLKLNDETGLFSESLVEALSIDEEEYIPYKESREESIQNVDYRIFRSKPFIRFKNKRDYAVINNQLLCERIFNSLYFDFVQLINGRKTSVGFFDYNKEFIEKELFRATIFNCIPSNQFSFPSRDKAPGEEDKNEPDFYTRKGSDLLIFECKAIKMNGAIRDDGDYWRLLDELHEKIVLKTRNLDPSRKQHNGDPEPIGIGQLLHHIEAIDEDEFKWDDNIPDEVTYYPIIVFEDVRILQPGLLSILNNWFNEETAKRDEFNHIVCGCQPVMAVSINTLYLYDDLLRRKGLTRIIDEFVRTHSDVDKDGNSVLYSDADFDAYLRNNPFQKCNTLVRWITSK